MTSLHESENASTSAAAQWTDNSIPTSLADQVPPITIFIPGKVMLCGEYDVLFGGTSLSCSTDHGLTVTLSPKDDDKAPVSIASSLWPEEILLGDPFNDYSETPLLDAVVQAFRRFDLPLRGYRVSVSSQLEPTHGVGSSSALRLGVSLACHLAHTWLSDKTHHVDISMSKALDFTASEWEVVRFAYKLQKSQQKNASGYDFVTQYLGGLILFTPPLYANGDAPLTALKTWPASAQSIDDRYPDVISHLNDLVDIYVGGKGAATTGHIKDCMTALHSDQMQQELRKVSQELSTAFQDALTSPIISQSIKSAVDEQEPGVHHLPHNDIADLCSAMGNHRRFFESLPHFPVKIGEQLGQVPGLDETWSYKTTGAGGEDAILVAGHRQGRQDVEAVLAGLGWFRAPFKFASFPTSCKIG